MIGIVELAVILGTTFVILVLLIVVLVLWVRSRRAEREQRWRQLGSVYDHQERRIRGD